MNMNGPSATTTLTEEMVDAALVSWCSRLEPGEQQQEALRNRLRESMGAAIAAALGVSQAGLGNAVVAVTDDMVGAALASWCGGREPELKQQPELRNSLRESMRSALAAGFGAAQASRGDARHMP